MDYEEITARLAEVMQILKGQHIARSLDDDLTAEEIADYRARYEALTKAMGCVMALKLVKDRKKPNRMPKPETDLANKCGSCVYYDESTKCSIGCRCTNEYMNKRRTRDESAFKCRTCRACKQYKARNEYAGDDISQ